MALKIEAKMGKLYALPLILTAVDQASKFFILDLIFFPPRIINVFPFLKLTPVWNKGVSFGFLSDAGSWAPIAITLFAVAIAAIFPYVSRTWHSYARFGAQLMAGGALGNAIDRMIHGKVVDFIDVFAGQWHWPAFNVADSVIVIGAGFVLLGSIKDSQSQSKS